MRIPRLYVDSAIATGQALTLDEAPAHYLSRVLRVQPGRPVVLFNGSGRDFHATVTSVRKNSIELTIDRDEVITTESPVYTHLGLGLSKGDRFDWALQKATELGVSEITPLFSDHCDVKLPPDRQEKRLRHWQQVMISACEQCQRSVIPRLNAPIELATWLLNRPETLRWVLHPEVSENTIASEAPCSIALLIGPEGGLSEHEVELALSQQFTGLRLGSRILRTETAPVVALAIIQQRWGDFST